MSARLLSEKKAFVTGGVLALAVLPGRPRKQLRRTVLRLYPRVDRAAGLRGRQDTTLSDGSATAEYDREGRWRVCGFFL